MVLTLLSPAGWLQLPHVLGHPRNHHGCVGSTRHLSEEKTNDSPLAALVCWMFVSDNSTDCLTDCAGT